jgi:hypothetical protein
MQYSNGLGMTACINLKIPIPSAPSFSIGVGLKGEVQTNTAGSTTTEINMKASLALSIEFSGLILKAGLSFVGSVSGRMNVLTSSCGTTEASQNPYCYAKQFITELGGLIVGKNKDIPDISDMNTAMFSSTAQSFKRIRGGECTGSCTDNSGLKTAFISVHEDFLAAVYDGVYDARSLVDATQSRANDADKEAARIGELNKVLAAKWRSTYLNNPSSSSFPSCSQITDCQGKEDVEVCYGIDRVKGRTSMAGADRADAAQIQPCTTSGSSFLKPDTWGATNSTKECQMNIETMIEKKKKK